MLPLPDLAKYGDLGLALLAIGALIYIARLVAVALKGFLAFLEHQLANINANTEATREMAAYLKLRNGTLDSALHDFSDRLSTSAAQQHTTNQLIRENNSLMADYKKTKRRRTA